MKDENKTKKQLISELLDLRRRVASFEALETNIADRKPVEERLKESEEKYRVLIEESLQGLVIAQGIPPRLVFVNPAMTKILGYTSEELTALSPKEIEGLLYLEDRKVFFERYRDLLEGKPALELYEIRGIRKDGTVIWLELSSTRIEYKGASAVQATFLEITERKRAEEALRQSEEKYRTILENIEDGYYEVDLAGEFTFFNDSVCRFLGYSREELMGVNNPKYTDPKNSKKLYQAFNKVYRTGEPVKEFNWEIIRKDGTKRIGEVSISLIKDSEGKPIGFRGIARDITERKRAEEALHTEKQRFQSLSENAPFGMVMVDKDGTFDYINPKFKELFGYDLNDVPNGKTWFRKAFPDPAYRHQVISAWIEGLESSNPGEKRSRIFKVNCKNGTEKIIHFIPVQLEIGENLMVCEDITDLNRAEVEKVALEEQLRQSQRMEAIGRLAGGIAHDFNNLLTIIKGYSQLSLMELKEGDPLTGNILEIHKASERAATLTRQLLAFSRRQMMEMSIFNLNSLVKDLDKMLGRVIGEDIELIIILAEDLGRVKSDLGQIEQVIMNIAVNARDAMPKGGKLIVETANVKLDEVYAHGHSSVIPGRYVRLSVSDTGIGMTPEVRDRVFEPFFSTKEIGKGTGLGLSMVYGIVKQSGGNIWVYSEPEKGTTFKIYLPRVDEPSGEIREKVIKDEFPRGSETVLVVEDEEEVRKLAVRVLGRQGYNVLEASQGGEAFLICEQHKDPIHLMVTDVVMPKMSGPDLAKRLSSIHPEMKVLYMSGYTDNAIVHHGFLEKGIHYLQKPFTPDALARKVRVVLDAS